MTEAKVPRKKQILALSILAILMIVSSWLLFYYGRQHKVIIDNRSVEMPDGTNHRALAGALVAINKNELQKEDEAGTPAAMTQKVKLSFKFWPQADPSIVKTMEMMPRERILVKVLGPEFNLKFEAYDKMGDPLGRKDMNIRLGSKRDAMVRLVKLQHGLDGYLEEYPNQARERQTARPKEEEAPASAAPSDAPAPPSFDE